jgi:hypothetical protein
MSRVSGAMNLARRFNAGSESSSMRGVARATLDSMVADATRNLYGWLTVR